MLLIHFRTLSTLGAASPVSCALALRTVDQAISLKGSNLRDFMVGGWVDATPSSVTGAEWITDPKLLRYRKIKRIIP